MASEQSQTASGNVTYYTVIYRVEGGREPHNEWWRTISNQFAGNDQIKVQASASFDALARLDELEELTW